VHTGGAYRALQAEERRKEVLAAKKEKEEEERWQQEQRENEIIEQLNQQALSDEYVVSH